MTLVSVVRQNFLVFEHHHVMLPCKPDHWLGLYQFSNLWNNPISDVILQQASARYCSATPEELRNCCMVRITDGRGRISDCLGCWCQSSLQQPCLYILSLFQVYDDCHYFTHMSFCSITTEKNVNFFSKHIIGLFILKTIH